MGRLCADFLVKGGAEDRGKKIKGSNLKLTPKRQARFVGDRERQGREERLDFRACGRPPRKQTTGGQDEQGKVI